MSRLKSYGDCAFRDVAAPPPPLCGIGYRWILEMCRLLKILIRSKNIPVNVTFNFFLLSFESVIGFLQTLFGAPLYVAFEW